MATSAGWWRSLRAESVANHPLATPYRGPGVRHGLHVHQDAQPCLPRRAALWRLMEDSRETVNLAIEDEGEAVYLARVECRQMLRADLERAGGGLLCRRRGARCRVALQFGAHRRRDRRRRRSGIGSGSVGADRRIIPALRTSDPHLAELSVRGHTIGTHVERHGDFIGVPKADRDRRTLQVDEVEKSGRVSVITRYGGRHAGNQTPRRQRGSWRPPGRESPEGRGMDTIFPFAAAK
jgi:hypothetical protein